MPNLEGALDREAATGSGGRAPARSQVETIRFAVRGMTCGSCVARISRAVRGLPGVNKVRVDLRHETATVRREVGVASNEALAAAIVAAGYEVGISKLEVLPETTWTNPLARLLGRR